MQDNEIFGSLFSGPEYEPTERPDNEVSNAVTETTISFELDEETHTLDQRHTLRPQGDVVVSSRETLSGLQDKYNELTNTKIALDREAANLRREFELAMARIDERLNYVRNDMFDLRREITKAQQAVQAAEHAFRVAMIALMKQRDFIENTMHFDEVTAGLAWREWAMEHQINGAKFIANSGRAICADKMGLGKSLTSLITADMLQAQKLLIIVPDDVASNFGNEVAQWAPHRTTVIIGKRTKGEREAILSVLESLDEFTVIVNYSAWRKDKSLLMKLAKLRFTMMVIDEAHTIKTTSTAAFLGVKEIAHADNACPECGGAIQHINDRTARVHQERLGRFIPQSYYVCVGKKPTTNSTMSVDSVDLSDSCLWSGLKDAIDQVKRPHGYLRSVKNIIPMTGTPILNSPVDLYPLLHLIDDANFNNANEFVREYCFRDQYTNRIYFKPGGLESLVKQLSGMYIARDRKSAGVVLPKQELVVHNIEFDKDAYPKQYDIIKQLSHHAAIMLESGQVMTVLAIIALITRKRQANVWPAGIKFSYPDPESPDPENPIMIEFNVGDDCDESIKLDYLIKRPKDSESGDWEGMVPEYTGMGDMLNGDRMIIFSQFRDPLAELETRMRDAGIKVVRFDGSTPDHIRDQVKTDFNRSWLAAHPEYTPQWQVALVNYKTGGVGLNFTDAVHVIALDEEWNPGKEEQAFNRIDRIGQTQESTAHILRLNGTIDAWMAGLISEKRDTIDGFESSMEENDLYSFLAKELMKDDDL